ncbi:MAG: hypothetical protein GY854_09270 [Deltaproteobacteria bacterium]|nr:hypothetical protein [Deltaproteobacteria bacterium]
MKGGADGRVAPIPSSYDECHPGWLDAVKRCCGQEKLDDYHCTCLKWWEQRDDNPQTGADYDSACAGKTFYESMPGQFYKDLMERPDKKSIGGWACNGLGCYFEEWDAVDQGDSASYLEWEYEQVCEEGYDFTGDFFLHDNVTFGHAVGQLNAYMGALEVKSGFLMMATPGHRFYDPIAMAGIDPYTCQVMLPWLTNNPADCGIEVQVDVTAALDRLDDRQVTWNAPGYTEYDVSGQHPVTLGIKQALNDRFIWESNGAVVDSCREYAYEKFYRYNKFMDFSAQFGSDYREIFNVAFGRSMYDSNKIAQISDKDLLDTWNDAQPISSSQTWTIWSLLSHFDGVINTTGILSTPGFGTFLLNQPPQNEFFGVDVYGAPEITNINGEDLNDIQLYGALMGCPLDDLYCNKANKWGIMEPDDEDALWPLLMNGPVLIPTDGERSTSSTSLEIDVSAMQIREWFNREPHDMDWHVEQSYLLSETPPGLAEEEDDEYNGIYSDEELYVYDRLKAELRRLLKKRQDLVAQALKEQTGAWVGPGGILPPTNVDLSIPGIWLKFINLYIDPSSFGNNFNSLLELFYGNLFGNFMGGGLTNGEFLAELMAAQNTALTSEQLAEFVAVLNELTGANTQVVEEPIATGGNQTPTSNPGPVPIPEPIMGIGDHTDVSKVIVGAVDGNQRAIVQIYRLDRIIADILEIAWKMGCYDLSDNDPNPCDWSPKLFTESLNFDLASRVEESYQSCTEATQGKDFMSIHGASNIGCGNGEQYGPKRLFSFTDGFVDYSTDEAIDIWMNGEDYSNTPMAFFGKDTGHMDKYIDGRKNLCEFAAGEAMDKARKKAQVISAEGKPKGDDVEKGNKYIKLWEKHSWDFDIDNLDSFLNGGVDFEGGDATPESNLGAHLSGHLAAGVDLFGMECEMIRVQGGVNAAVAVPGNGDDPGTETSANLALFVAGQEFWSGSCSFEDAKCSEEGADFSSQIFEAKSRFTIGPVPMSITVGVTGKMGVTYAPVIEFDYPEEEQLEGGWEQFRGEGNAFQLNIEAGLLITPYAGLDAFAELAIDAWVLSVGVRAELTIINLAFPFKASLGFRGELGYDPTKTVPRTFTNLELTYSTDLTAVLRTLDGRIYVFVKVDIGFWEKTWKKKLASWNGPRIELPIFDLEGNFASDKDFELDIPTP